MIPSFIFQFKNMFGEHNGSSSFYEESGLSPFGKIGAPWAPQKAIKRHNKSSHFHENWWFPSFPFFVVVGGGSFFKMDFRRRPFNQNSLVFRKSPRTHLEVQGSFGDEGTFQDCQKSWILKIPLFGETENWRPGVYFDAEYVSAHFCRVKTPWIAIWEKHFFCIKSSFSFFPL